MFLHKGNNVKLLLKQDENVHAYISNVDTYRRKT